VASVAIWVQLCQTGLSRHLEFLISGHSWFSHMATGIEGILYICNCACMLMCTGVEGHIGTSSWFRWQVVGSWRQCEADSSPGSETSVDDDDIVEQQDPAAHSEQEPDGSAVDAVEWQVDSLESVQSVGSLTEIGAPSRRPRGDRCTPPWSGVPGGAVVTVWSLTRIVQLWQTDVC